MNNDFNLSMTTKAGLIAQLFNCISCCRPSQEHNPDSRLLNRPRELPDFYESIKAQRGNRISPRLCFSAGSAAKQSADQYFDLMDAKLAEVKGHFTAVKFASLSDRIGHPWERD